MAKTTGTFFSSTWLRKQQLLNGALIWGVFALALALIVIRPLGLHFSIIRGVYGDTRLINFILEHVTRWFAGQDASLWNTNSFYPFPLTLAFSDNLLGAAPFYAILRWTGLDQETALQGWYLVGFFLNYAAASFALSRLKFSAPAITLGAFFFTFGLPMLAQESHYQLLYRFCVPLACTLLWEFALNARLRTLGWIVFLVVWQLFMGVYTGVFLILLLAALFLLMPFFMAQGTAPLWKARLTFWLARFRQAWAQSSLPERALTPLISTALLASLAWLFAPYVEVQRLYGFARGWEEVTNMLPRLQSYWVDDRLPYWYPISIRLWGMPTMRNEHQLFAGLGVYALLAVGVISRKPSPQRKVAFLHLLALLVLVLLTLDVGGFSLWRAVYILPGMSSIRSVTRVQLVLMWPLALFCAYTLDAWRVSVQKPVWVALGTLLVGAALLAEPFLYTDGIQFSKTHAQNRLTELRNQLPAVIPARPILFVAVKKDESFVISEADGMLLAQDLNWPTLNGYFGNFPPEYHPADSCIELPRRIISYMRFAHITDEGYYLGMMARVVPVGFSDCDPSWWKKMP